MEVFQTNNFYIFVKNEKSLWWNRTSSEFSVKKGWDLSSVDDIECLGITQGIIGVVSLPGVYEPHLVIIKEAVPVGVLYAPNLVYKIKSICALSSSTDTPENILMPCSRHKKKQTTPNHKPKMFEGNQLMNKTWGAVRSAGTSIKNTTKQAATKASNQVKSSVGIRDPIRIEKRITEELQKVFDDSDSFYYCIESDITNNLQRHIDGNDYDERFFWNMHMLSDIMKLEDKDWVLPVIQGFVQVEQFVIGNECFTLALVSRRSRHRAGTRYKRRGVDCSGNCANYVETEQILSFRQHQLSFTQVRGSVPVYWSQPGYKYRPPPRLDKAEEETQEAFEKHFLKELSIYDGVCIVNLVEQSGKEKIIGDAFAKHVVQFNNDQIVYVTFDFHDYCRGMRFENVSALVEALAPEISAMGFHWRDSHGIICNQKSVFRINCMDCLDRTNVVQTALGKIVLEAQLVKIGLSPPYSSIKASLMVLWANNGDVISRQYAGTNALKGDYTRTGERKFAGMFKDGMNSANRYYLARFKDTFRQATIDLMLGNQITQESLNVLGGQQAPDDNDALECAEHAKLVVEYCRRVLLRSAQNPIGSWSLIDANPGTEHIHDNDVDVVLLLTNETYIVAYYDSCLDKIVRFEKVPLQNMTMIELGLHQQTHCLRLNYKIDNNEGFHMFRSANIRFFNNVVEVLKTEENILESLMSIVEIFKITLNNIGKTDVVINTEGELQKRIIKDSLMPDHKGMPRNVSESQLLQSSSKALSNVADHFYKFGQNLNPRKAKSFLSPSSNFNPTQHDAKEIPEIKPLNSDKLEPEKVLFSLEPFDTLQGSAASSDSENIDKQPEIAIEASAETIFNETDFLPSVGILMYPNVNETAGMANQLEISITPVTASENPSFEDITQATQSRNLTLPVGTVPQTEFARQVKTLTSPLSKLAKGMQSIGMNLDPRKIGKNELFSPSEVSSAENSTPDLHQLGAYRDHLEEIWTKNECRSKLIAL